MPTCGPHAARLAIRAARNESERASLARRRTIAVKLFILAYVPGRLGGGLRVSYFARRRSCIPRRMATAAVESAPMIATTVTPICGSSPRGHGSLIEASLPNPRQHCVHNSCRVCPGVLLQGNCVRPADKHRIRGIADDDLPLASRRRMRRKYVPGVVTTRKVRRRGRGGIPRSCGIAGVLLDSIGRAVVTLILDSRSRSGHVVPLIGHFTRR